MAKQNQKSEPNYKIVAENRRARFDYAIDEDLECGVVLMGSEVKSLRENSANIAESLCLGRGWRALADQQLYRPL